MKNIHGFYAAAKENLKTPTLEHKQWTIDQNLGRISVFKTDLVAASAKSKLPETEKKAILAESKIAVASISNFVEYLHKIDLKNPRSFRLGKELYAKKFNFDIQSGYSSDEIYQKAVAHKKELHDKMF
jgi:hypothetical protein